jgi:hypothetical protein
VFAFARLREATTTPVVGEMVSEPSTLLTDVTPPAPAHEPSGSLKQPLVSTMPLAKVEVAFEVESRAPAVIVTPADEERPAVVIPPAKVEVAVEVEVRLPTTRLPIVDDETSSFTNATGEEVAE